jgi:prepilin-type N-terminal cleavage/methylation domain-containing protein
MIARAFRHHAGFTLVELVMVMVLIGVLAVFAAPRMMDLTAWRLRAFSDTLQAETLAMQRRAITQRRPITATIVGTGVSFTDATGTLATLACPAAASPCIAEAGPRSVTFNAAHSGRATTSTGAALTLTIGSGDAQRRLAIAHETGLIHPLP